MLIFNTSTRLQGFSSDKLQQQMILQLYLHANDVGVFHTSKDLMHTHLSYPHPIVIIFKTDNF